MRFLTLTTIAIAVLASVSALPVDSIRDVGQTREDIPLSKRAEQLEPSAGAASVPGNGQDYGVGAANNGEPDGAPQEKAPLSKRNKKSKDATADQKNGGGATNPDGTPQGPGSLSKRNKKEKDATAGQKNGGGATNPDDAPQGTKSLSKRNKKEKDATAGQKNGGGATNPDGTPQGPGSLSKRNKKEKDATAGQDGGSPNTGISPNDGPPEPLSGDEASGDGM